jgi:hypothetical protein
VWLGVNLAVIGRLRLRPAASSFENRPDADGRLVPVNQFHSAPMLSSVVRLTLLSLFSTVNLDSNGAEALESFAMCGTSSSAAQAEVCI